MTETPPVCPSCRRIDQVRKVSSIVTEGTARVGYSDVLGTLAGSGSAVYQTALSQRLAPPARPEEKTKKQPASLETRQFGKIIMFGLVGLLGLWLAVFKPVDNVVCVATGWFFALLVVFWFILLIIGEINGKHYATNITRREISSDKLEADRDYEIVWAPYYRAVSKWNESFYCYRCDGVFTRSSRFVPIGLFHSFLRER